MVSSFIDSCRGNSSSRRWCSRPKSPFRYHNSHNSGPFYGPRCSTTAADAAAAAAATNYYCVILHCQHGWSLCPIIHWKPDVTVVVWHWMHITLVSCSMPRRQNMLRMSPTDLSRPPLNTQLMVCIIYVFFLYQTTFFIPFSLCSECAFDLCLLNYLLT